MIQLPRAGALLAIAVLAAGCAATPRFTTAPEDRPCREALEAADGVVAEAGKADAQAARVAGFPHLRIDRFLASYAQEPLEGVAFDEWVGRLAALADEGRRIELANLPAAPAAGLARRLEALGIDTRDGLEAALSRCASRLAATGGSGEERAALRRAARVPDDYLTWQRVVGLYWLTRIAFANGIAEWHREVEASFAQPLTVFATEGKPILYGSRERSPLARAQVRAILERSASDALGIPDPRGADLEALFLAFAPAYVIDTTAPSDQPGELGWRDGRPAVVSQRPVVYRRVAHARLDGRALLQLVYTMWFPERPRDAGSSWLAGRLDGLVWRVTLAPDGSPWVYDTIHPCGCYHLFLPTGRARAKPQPQTLDEKAFVPQTAPTLDATQPLTLWLERGTHYLRRVTAGNPVDVPRAQYELVDDDALRSIPLQEGRASLFGPDGIVPGTKRAERWFFWPMGVPEPGAMRQWGRHATAFVGRRHFDDPHLLERLFTWDPPADAGTPPS